MKPLVTDERWEVVAPLLPRRRPQPKGGRPWVDDRAVLTGILFVLRSGIPWRMLPPEMGCGSGVTCWRRLKGYDDRRCRDACVRRGIKHRIGRKGIESKTRLGRRRWVVERTFAWVARYRRLTIRDERLVAVHRAFLHLACALICFNYLRRL